MALCAQLAMGKRKKKNKKKKRGTTGRVAI
jgi:hypothetical protein